MEQTGVSGVRSQSKRGKRELGYLLFLSNCLPSWQGKEEKATKMTAFVLISYESNWYHFLWYQITVLFLAVPELRSLVVEFGRFQNLACCVCCQGMALSVLFWISQKLTPGNHFCCPLHPNFWAEAAVEGAFVKSALKHARLWCRMRGAMTRQFFHHTGSSSQARVWRILCLSRGRCGEKDWVEKLYRRYICCSPMLIQCICKLVSDGKRNVAVDKWKLIKY